MGWEQPRICVECGEPATHRRPYRDECPTDRGTEVREGWEWVCDDCDKDDGHALPDVPPPIRRRAMKREPRKPYIIVANMPACSAVLFVNRKEITILSENSRQWCEAFAVGFRAGSGMKEAIHAGSVDLPAGNPAVSYADLLKKQGTL